jgi:hypothetical protein
MACTKQLYSFFLLYYNRVGQRTIRTQKAEEYLDMIVAYLKCHLDVLQNAKENVDQFSNSICL